MPKKNPHASPITQRPAPVEPEAADTTRAAEEDDAGLDSRDQRLLAAALRFLVNVQQPSLGRVALAHGYTREEHAEGWRLHRAASGEGHAFDVVVGLAGDASPAVESHMPTLRRVDAFENTWFPRARAIIRRVVPEAGRERFEAAFFHEMAQQPLGPAVIGSVRTFLARVDSLAKSQEPGAREVRETLRKRGLTDAVAAEMRATLDGLSALAPAPAGSGRPLAKARAEQRRALGELRAWYNDWATTLRSVLNRRQLIQLGLVTASRRGGDEPDEPADPTPDA